MGTDETEEDGCDGFVAGREREMVVTETPGLSGNFSVTSARLAGLDSGAEHWDGAQLVWASVCWIVAGEIETPGAHLILPYFLLPEIFVVSTRGAGRGARREQQGWEQDGKRGRETRGKKKGLLLFWLENKIYEVLHHWMYA